MSSKTSKGGRPRVDSERIDARMERDLLDGIDACARNEGISSRPEAVRFIVRDWLVGHSYIENPPPKEDAN